MNIISICLVDAAAKSILPNGSSDWKTALAAIPEQRERSKICRYQPPRGVELWEHYNPRSWLVGRYLLRGLLVSKQQQQQQQQQRRPQAPQQEDSASCPISQSNAKCRCCGRHIQTVLRTFEARPCVAGPACSCGSDAPARDKNAAASSFVEDYPSVNISHNNGVVLAGILPTMRQQQQGAGGGHLCDVVLGVDVMCIDTVPTAMRNGDAADADDEDDESHSTSSASGGGLDQFFTPEVLDEFVDMMQPYMTSREWVWINNSGCSTVALTQQQRDFAQLFYTRFEQRRKLCYPPSPQSAPPAVNSNSQFLSNPRNIVNLYRTWRFLVLWAIKEAVLKAAGIGLGFDTTNIEVEFVSSKNVVDIDDSQFYSAVLQTKSQPFPVLSLAPSSTVRITLKVPPEPKDFFLAGSTIGPQHFSTWLVWDRDTMSVSCIVAAPAFVSKFSGHKNYVYRPPTAFSALVQQTSLTPEQRDEKLDDEHLRQAKEILALSHGHPSVVSSLLLTLRILGVSPAAEDVLLQVHGVFGREQTATEESGNASCCGCCFAACLKY